MLYLIFCFPCVCGASGSQRDTGNTSSLETGDKNAQAPMQPVHVCVFDCWQNVSTVLFYLFFFCFFFDNFSLFVLFLSCTLYFRILKGELFFSNSWSTEQYALPCSFDCKHEIDFSLSVEIAARGSCREVFGLSQKIFVKFKSIRLLTPTRKNVNEKLPVGVV